MIGRSTFVGGAAALIAVRGAAMPGGSRFTPVVERFAAEHRFNGVVAHGRRGRRDYIGCFGLADVSVNRPVTPATRFAFGSASKWLTLVAVLRLVEQGRLDLDRPITACLPDFRADTAARPTLRRLLSNTSRLPDRLTAAIKNDPVIRTSTEGSAPMVARFAGGDLAFEPGRGWDYAFLNWVVVHAIVERVTGEPFAAAMERLVFRPLGMRGAGLVDTRGGRTAATASAYSSVAPIKPKMAGTPPLRGRQRQRVRLRRRRDPRGIFAGRLLSAWSRAALTGIEWAPEDYALGGRGRVRTVAGRRWAWEPGKTCDHPLDRCAARAATRLIRPVRPLARGRRADGSEGGNDHPDHQRLGRERQHGAGRGLEHTHGWVSDAGRSGPA